MLIHYHYSSLCDEGHSTVGFRSTLLLTYRSSSLCDGDHCAVDLTRTISLQIHRPSSSHRDSHSAVDLRTTSPQIHYPNSLHRDSHSAVNLRTTSLQIHRSSSSHRDSHSAINSRPTVLWAYHRSSSPRSSSPCSSSPCRNTTPTRNPGPAVLPDTLNPHRNQFLQPSSSVRYNGLYTTHPLISPLISMIDMSLPIRSYFFSPLNAGIGDSKCLIIAIRIPSPQHNLIYFHSRVAQRRPTSGPPQD